jgi:polo-like kinase 1
MSQRLSCLEDLATHPFLSADAEPKFKLPDCGLAIAKLRAVPKPAPPPEREENQQVPKSAPPRRDEGQQVPMGVARDVIVMPMNCVSRFCDHSDRHGLRYLLADGTIGACFNDLTRMVMGLHEWFVQYWESYQPVTPGAKQFETKRVTRDRRNTYTEDSVNYWAREHESG